MARYGEEKSEEPDRLMSALFNKPRPGSMGLLRDLQDLWLMADEAEVTAIILRQAAAGGSFCQNRRIAVSLRRKGLFAHGIPIIL